MTRRRAIAAQDVIARKAITSESLANAGKLPPASPPKSKLEEEVKKPKKADEETETVTKMFVPIAKANTEEQTVTGVVLQPEVVDAQGDIIGEDVIRKAAHRFLADYNKATKLGLMHKDFKRRFELFESFIAPCDLVVGDRHVSKGAWLIVVKVLDSAIWEKVKKGELTGFSIGGKARVKKLAPVKQVA